MLTKGAIRKVQLSKREFVSSLFLVKKEGCEPKTSDEFEATESTYPISSLQNGRFAKYEIHVAKRRLHVQTRLKICIFFSSLGKKFKAICSLSLVRKVARVPLPLLWFGASNTNIHKIAKSANDNLTQDQHQNNNLLRRHVIDWSLFRRDCHEPRHSNLPSATSRICLKPGKVCVDTSAGNRVFGPDNQLCHSRTFFKQNKNSESSLGMSEFVKKSTNINSGVGKVDWLVDVKYSSSFTSKVELSFPSNTTNIIFIRKKFFFSQNCFEQNLKNRTKMVVTKLRTVQSSGINSIACRRVNTGRYLNKELEGNVQWNLRMGDVVIEPHKCLRTFSYKTGYTNVLENLKAQSHSSPGGQHGSFDISVKDGGYPEFKTITINKRNMGSSSPMWDHSYCRVPSQQTERDSRLGVKKQFGLLGMEASSPVISENLSTEGNSRDRSICFQIISSDQDLLFVEVRSIEPSSRCLKTKLVPQESLCFSLILHDPKS